MHSEVQNSLKYYNSFTVSNFYARQQCNIQLFYLSVRYFPRFQLGNVSGHISFCFYILNFSEFFSFLHSQFPCINGLRVKCINSFYSFAALHMMYRFILVTRKHTKFCYKHKSDHTIKNTKINVHEHDCCQNHQVSISWNANMFQNHKLCSLLLEPT